jgi:PIN domain nuclease of toxin-antitoxin system
VATLIRLDTHVVVWLYGGQVRRLSDRVRKAIDNEDVAISPAVELELVFLNEIGRLRVAANEIVADLHQRIGLTTSDATFTSVVGAARPLAWTRDPFDRLIVGDAIVTNATLLTKDEVILERCPLATW